MSKLAGHFRVRGLTANDWRTGISKGAMITGLFFVILAFFGGFVAQDAGATVSSNSNETIYWENLYGTQFPNLECYKHNVGSNDHGFTSTIQPGDSNDAVTLNVFNPNWYGDKFVLLIVNAGNVDNITVNPVSGTPYMSTLGDNGRYKTVSHWIVCKGFNGTTTTTTSTTTTTTKPTTTTTSTTKPTTTTTIPSTTTTMATTSTTAATTTTTCPDCTVVTVVTIPETTTTVVDTTTTTKPSTTTTEVSETTTTFEGISTSDSRPPVPMSAPLPVTGAASKLVAAIGFAMIFCGIVLWIASRKK